MMELRHYIDAFSSLHTAKVKGHKAPHKAILLLAIIDLIEEDFIMTPYIDLTDELNEKFNDIWHSLGNQRKFLYATRIYDRNN